MSLNSKVAVKRPHISGSYSAASADGQDRLSIQFLAQPLSVISSAKFLGEVLAQTMPLARHHEEKVFFHPVTYGMGQENQSWDEFSPCLNAD